MEEMVFNICIKIISKENETKQSKIRQNKETKNKLVQLE